MRNRRPLLLVFIVLFAGCSASSTSPPKPERAAKLTPGDGLRKCAEDIGYTVMNRGGGRLQVTSPSGIPKANATTWSTVKAARRFDAQLQVPSHVQRGRLVTVFLPGNLDKSELDVLLSCASKG